MPPLTPEEQARALAIHNPLAAIASRMPSYSDVAEALTSPGYVPGYLRDEVAPAMEQVPGIGAGAGFLVRAQAGMMEDAGAGMPTPPAAPFSPSGIPGLADQLRAAGASAKSGGTASTSTRLGRPQDEPYLEGERAAGEQLAGQQTTLAEQQTRVNTLHDQTIRDWAQEAKDAHARFGEVGVEMAKEYRDTASELKTARDQLKGMKVDPTRLWDSMPTTQKVLMSIGSLAGGFAEGASGGKMQNDVGRWWEQAVTRDIEQQRDAIKSKMSEVELGTKEREEIWKKWQQSEDQIRTAAGRASQLEISRLALATDDVKMKGELAKSIADIGSRVRTAEHGEFVAAQSTTTKTASSGGGTGAGAGVSKEGVQSVLFYNQAVKSAQEAKDLIRENGGTIPYMGANAERFKHAVENARVYQARAQGMTGRQLSATMKATSDLWPTAASFSDYVGGALGLGVPKVRAGEMDNRLGDIEMEAKLALASLGSKQKKVK